LAVVEGTLDTQRASRRERFRHQARVLRVIAGAEFKLKYSDSILGYFWSVIKPLSYFAVLWVVFGRFFKLGAAFHEYPLYLIVGLVLWTFFADSTTLTMHSFVSRSSLLRKLAFPRLVVPAAASMVALITFAINITVVGVFVAAQTIRPRLEWLLIPPLLLEFYAVTFAFGLILAVLHVRFRDVGQIWELLSQLLFFAVPIMYPLGLLPSYARELSLLNPITQVMQDIRSALIAHPPPGAIITSPDVLGSAGRLYPILIVMILLVLALFLYRREEPWLAERA
jgi:ABC-2 type transport system permease protein